MKVLIAYDGSDCADAAINDLTRAGLPADTEALILTAVETWLPPEDWEGDSYVNLLGFTGGETLNQIRETAQEKIAEGEELAQKANLRVQRKFPTWQVWHKTMGGFPEREILEVAKKWQPNLIVVSSHGRGAAGRFMLGSVSLKVLSEAVCSVRVARRPQSRAEKDDSPLRIVVAVDGSYDSKRAIEAAARRVWKPETSIRLVTVIENLPYSVLLEELPEAEEQRRFAMEILKQKHWHLSQLVMPGRAKTALVEEAEKWGADSIFIGAKGHRFLERILLGSVSYRVAARAHCSVEVIR